MAENPDLAWAIQDIRARAPRISKHRDLYEGNHPQAVDFDATLSGAMRSLLEALNDNLCDDVVDEPVARMGIKAITSAKPELAAAARKAFKLNKGDARVGSLFRDAFMAADSYAIVEEDKNGRARFYPQAPESMAVRYSPNLPDAIELAAKVWQEGKRWRITLYYGPEHDAGPLLLRYASKGSSAGGGIPEARSFLPLDGQDADGNDLAAQVPEWTRIPVFHFPTGEVGRYGRSVLSDVEPLQLLLNKSLADLVVAMEEVALPGRWATGIQVAYNEDGSEKPLLRRSRSALEILRTASENAQFGQFAGAALNQFLDIQDSYRREIARKGYLPLRSVGLEGSGQPSGISLLVEEGRQVKRVKNAERDWGEELLAMLTYMLELEGHQVGEDDLDLEWERVETRDDQALWELLMIKKDMGVPDKVLLVEGGYDPKEVEEWLDGEAEADDAMEGGRLSAPGEGIGALGLGLPPLVPAGAPAPGLPV